jgi:hypothetical protein
MTMITLDASVPSPTPLFDGDSASSTTDGATLPLLPLPTVFVGGDVGADLAILGVQSGQLQHAEANDDRNAEEALAQSQADQEVQALRSEAGSMRSQAWMDGALALAQASTGGKSGTIGALLSGVKGVGDGLYASDQKNDEATAKGFEAAVAVSQSGVSGAHDAISDADQLVQSALDFYKEYVATQGQTANTAASGRA